MKNKYLKNKYFKFATKYASTDELISYCIDPKTKQVRDDWIKHFLIGKIGIEESIVKNL